MIVPSFKLSDHLVKLCSAIALNPKVSKTESAYQLINILGEEGAYKLTAENEVHYNIAHILMSNRLLSRISNKWFDAHAENQRKVSVYMSEMDNIGNIFEENGIKVIALKNAGIARGILSCHGCCPMGDIDLLIEKGNFKKAHELLLKNGYEFEFRSQLEEVNIDHALISGGAEYWKILSNGDKLWLELQWRPVAGRWIRPDQEPSAEELIKRSQSVEDSTIRIVCPEDNLLQVCLHTAKHSYVRAPGFRLHLDVDRIVSLQNVEWDRFVDMVLKLKVRTPVYFSLIIPKSIFHTKIPSFVLETVRPPHWKEIVLTRWIRRAGLFNPHDKKFGKLGYIVFNALLYDDLNGLLKGMFPERSWMINAYKIRHGILLPYYYMKRLLSLLIKRVGI